MRPAVVVLIAVLVLSFGSMPVYALVRRGRDQDALRKGSQFFVGLGDFLMHWFLWAIGPAERLALRLGLTPDVFNLGGLVFGLLSGFLIGSGRLESGGWAIGLAGICDVLDGRIARATNAASAYGKFIDSTLDRYVETFAFFGFAFYLNGRPFGPLLAAAALAGSLLVSYAQARGETVGVSGSGGLMQRAERLVLTCLACLLDPTLSRALGKSQGFLVIAVLWLVALGSFGTAVYRTLWIACRLREQDRRP